MGLNAVGHMAETTEVVLYHPETLEDLPGPGGKPMSVTLHGQYSERYKAVVRKQQQQRMQAVGRGGKIRIQSVEIEQFAEELLVSCVDSWNVSLEGDDPLPCTPEIIRDVFEKHPWVRTQVDSAFGSVADFLVKP